MTTLIQQSKGRPPSEYTRHCEAVLAARKRPRFTRHAALLTLAVVAVAFLAFIGGLK